MIAAHGTTKRLPPIVVERAWQHRPPTTLVIAAAWSLGIWFGLPELDAHARIAFVTFGLAIIGWVGTNINDTYIALAAALVFSVSGIDEPQEFFETLGDSTSTLR